MPSSDYTTSSGALKLKGVGGVAKHKKKKKSKPQPTESSPSTVAESEVGKEDEDNKKSKEKHLPEDTKHAIGREKASTGVKTEAELRFEENRRKRLEERLIRDGGRTHKEKVEELNRYLSRLSEHHDMYVIFVSSSLFCLY